MTASAQTPAPTYWLARPTATEYVFDVPLPAPLIAMVTCDPAKYARFAAYCQSSSQTVDGKSYPLVKTQIGWDQNLIDNGQVAYATGGAVTLDSWVNFDKNAAGWTAAVAELKQLATVSGTWKYVDMSIYAAPGASDATLRVPIPELTQIKTKMTQLAARTTAGTYYPSVTVPADLAAFRAQMLAYGNAGRRDPNFRKTNGSHTATDLSQDTVYTSDHGDNEKVYREFTTPPYFTDHKPNAVLDRAAQFQAEYRASIDSLGHDGPPSYLDPVTGRSVNMSDQASRQKFFNGPANVGEAGSQDSADGSPQGWMSGDTHFRPWFNVDGTYPEIGYGAAKSASGRWYTFAVPLFLKDVVVPLDRVALPLAVDVGTKEDPARSSITTDVTQQPDTSTTGPTKGPDAQTAPAAAAPAATEPAAPAATQPAAPVATQPAAPAVAGVTLCQNDSFAGPCSTVTADVPNLTGSEVGNDTLSSIRVPAGTWVSLYRDFAYGGTCRAFSSDQTSLINLPPGADQVSSVKVSTTAPTGCPTQDVLTLCPEDNFLGTCLTPDADQPNVTGSALGNDKLSSVLVPPGTYLSVYQDFDYKGICQSFSGDRAVLAGTRIGTDQASSFKITKTAPSDCAES